MEDGGHSYSLADVEKLLRTERDDKIVHAIGHIYGVVVALAPVAIGPAGFALWPLLDVKNELADAVAQLLPFLTKKREEPYVDRLKRLKMAVTTLIYVAYVDEARSWVQESYVGERPPNPPWGANDEPQPSDHLPVVVLRTPPAIGPFVGFSQLRECATEIYYNLTEGLAADISRSSPGLPTLDEPDTFVQRALARFEAAFVELCANHDELLLWAQCDSVLRGKEGLDERLNAILDHRHEIDLGLARLRELTGRILSAARPPEVPRQIAALHRAYAGDLGSPISISDERPAEGFAYPSKAEAFIPQQFSTVQQSGQAIHDEEFWAEQEVRDDVGVFLVGTFLAADSVHRPTLILGHPGSGKSLLSEMLAARLAPPFFTTIRVSLRDTDASLEIEDQIKHAVRRATGETIDWIELSASAAAPPIVVFDGLDELLLATGNSHVNFLERLAWFQQREFRQKRPVRIVVTSRLTLIHRMRVADGTCVIRLLDFSPEQQTTWIEIWNRTNASYFDTQRLLRFAVPDNHAVRVLAGQPLLLLMLAIYDAYENSLANAAAASRGELYESLVKKFVERERGKGTETGGIFRALEPEERAHLIAEDMDRLSIVALGMHKRARLFITRDELEADLALYVDATGPSDDRLALSTADLVLVSFFFIHRSSTKVEDDQRGYAFEFLHNTFGEFLLAALIAKRLRTRCEAKAALAATTWPEGADLASLEAAVHDLPPDLRDALQYQLLCMRPVILDMLDELIARAGWSQSLATVDELFARELHLCTDLDNAPPVTYQHRAIECANILSLASVMPKRPCAVACEETRWQQVVGLLRGALPLEELTQLASSVQTTVSDGKVYVVRASVVLAATDLPAAVHRVAFALQDLPLVTTARLATLDSLFTQEPIGRLEELLLASRVLRPVVWRRLGLAEADIFTKGLIHSAQLGLDSYPNSAIAAYTMAFARGSGLHAPEADLLRIFSRSLRSGVEAEVVADLVFQLLTTRHEDFQLRITMDFGLIRPILLPNGDRSQGYSELLLIGLCWLVFMVDEVRADLSDVLDLFRERMLSGGLLQTIMVEAPTFAWLPAAALLLLRSEAFGDSEFAAIHEACLNACARTEVGPDELSGVIRATSLLMLDTERMARLWWSIKKVCGERALRDAAVRYAEIGPDEMRNGWLYLLRKSSQAAEAWGLPRRQLSDWALVFSDPIEEPTSTSRAPDRRT